MYISGKIARVTDFETGLVGGCQWIDGKWDNSVSNPGRMIMDERYLAIDVKDKGLIVFSACSREQGAVFVGFVLIAKSVA
jgi:7,8-dihydropterin-6-yl-methyl-4-(beta-D-ribofuranosyl)aminobenzene 5'-phosphate synthase